jgi:hypothetical protein
MKPNFRKIKVSLVFAILLSVVFMAVAGLNNEDTASAVYTRVDFELDTDDNNSIAPGEVRTWQYEVSYEADPSISVIDPASINNIYKTTLQIEVIEGKEDWVTVTPSPSTLNIKPNEKRTVSVKVSLTDDAPYLKPHNIRLKATAIGAGMFEESFAEQTITIVPEFLYFVDATSVTNYAELNPGETHEFKVNVDNNAANKAVKFYFDTTGVPEDWVVSSPDSIIIPANSKEQVTVSVAPPYDFGYYDEIEEFQVKVSAMPFPVAEGYEKQEVDALNFQVRNRGFSASASGGGLLIIIGIIIAVIVILFLVFMILKTDMFKKKR